MSVWTESCSPASPTSTLFTTRLFFCLSLLLPHPPFYFVFPWTKVGFQSAARGFSWEFFTSDEEGTMSPCCREVWASDLLLPALLLTLGLFLLSRPISYTAVSPAMFLGFLSWHQARFSAANLAAESFLHCSLLAAILSLLHCSFSASSVVLICLLALCLSL